MELLLTKSLWGMEIASYNESFERIAKAGYKAVETPLPAPELESSFREALEEHGLKLIVMIFIPDEESRLELFERDLKRASTFNPLQVTCHALKDFTPFDTQVEFFRAAVKLEQQLGIPVGHETHRGRPMFNPWDAAKLLEQVPGMNITADFSHFCCVCESLLEDPELQSSLEVCIDRTIHIHGRVGYSQGPQVPDPRAPEYARELLAHEAWWDRIIAKRRAAGATNLTFTPEFGPIPYMPTIPYTHMPISNLWDICLWMAQRFEGRYAQ
jgi:hypothetical protein